MAEEKVTVLCAASAYDEKYYFNPQFNRLPEDIRKELKIISVLYTNEIGGIFEMYFNEEGNLEFRTEARGNDYNYDEIGATLMVKEIQRNKTQLLESIELYYKVVFLGQNLEDIEQ